MAGSLTTYKQGHRAEFLAAWMLRFKGYKIMTLRYKTPMGEIDIIAQKGNMLVFAEVKWRGDEVALDEAISKKSRRRIEKAAALYAQKNVINDAQWRFDAVLLSPKKWPRHIKQAWIFGE